MLKNKSFKIDADGNVLPPVQPKIKEPKPKYRPRHKLHYEDKVKIVELRYGEVGCFVKK